MLICAICGAFPLLLRAPFFEIFRRYDKQPERLAVLLGGFGVVGAVGTQNTTRVGAVELTEPLETLVDVHVVNQEIRQAVQRNTHSDEQHPKVRSQSTDHVAEHAGDGKHQEKAVVLFKKTFLFVPGLVVVFVPAPQPAVHQVFVRKPGHEFHAGIGGKRDEQVTDPGHVCRDFIKNWNEP